MSNKKDKVKQLEAIQSFDPTEVPTVFSGGRITISKPKEIAPEPVEIMDGNYPDQYPFGAPHRHPQEDTYINFALNEDFPPDGIPIDRLPKVIRELKKSIGVGPSQVTATFAPGTEFGDVVVWDNSKKYYKPATCPSAKANVASGTFFSGLANTDTGGVVTAGGFSNEAWNLTPGTPYYLDCANPGKLTTTDTGYLVGVAQGPHTLLISHLGQNIETLITNLETQLAALKKYVESLEAGSDFELTNPLVLPFSDKFGDRLYTASMGYQSAFPNMIDNGVQGAIMFSVAYNRDAFGPQHIIGMGFGRARKKTTYNSFDIPQGDYGGYYNLNTDLFDDNIDLGENDTWRPFIEAAEDSVVGDPPTNYKPLSSLSPYDNQLITLADIKNMCVLRGYDITTPSLTTERITFYVDEVRGHAYSAKYDGSTPARAINSLYTALAYCPSQVSHINLDFILMSDINYTGKNSLNFSGRSCQLWNYDDSGPHTINIKSALFISNGSLTINNQNIACDFNTSGECLASYGTFGSSILRLSGCNITLNNSGKAALAAHYLGKLYIQEDTTLSGVGSIAISLSMGAMCQIQANSFSGDFTGMKYRVIRNSALYTSGTGASSLPGSVGGEVDASSYVG